MYRTIYKATKLTNHQNHMTIKKKSDPAIFNQKIWYKTTTWRKITNL